MEERMDFELFKSQICHRVKREGDIDFIINVLKSDDIAIYFEKKWHLESLYLLAMIDYLCRIHDMPLVPWYDDLRKAKFTDDVTYNRPYTPYSSDHPCPISQCSSTIFSKRTFCRSNSSLTKLSI